MNFDHFVGQVQHRGQLPDTGSALWAIQATLQTFAERIDPGEAKDLASQLPRPLQIYFDVDEYAQPFSAAEFFKRVSAREQVDEPVAAFHARVVLEVLQDAVSIGELQDVMSELPRDWREILAAGSTGSLKLGDVNKPRRAKKIAESMARPRDTIETLRAKARTRAEASQIRRSSKATRTLAAKALE